MAFIKENYRFVLGDLMLLANRMLYVNSCRLLVFGDLHLGVEYALARDGVFIPPLQFNVIIREISEAISKLRPKKLIILGDLKHMFERRTPQEHKEVLRLLDFLQDTGLEIILVRGNHDTFIRGLLEKKGVLTTDYYICDKYLFIHGHKKPELRALEDSELSKKTLIFAHIHPTISLSDGIVRKRVPIFLVGKNKVVIPAMSPLLPGLDIFRGYYDDEFKSPILGNIEEYQVYALAKKAVIALGSVKKLMEIRNSMLASE